MSDFTTITSLNLGNTFGGWYAKNNQMIDRMNLLTVGSITGGDGVIVSKHPSVAGGYTLDIAGTIAKNVTFNGNVTVNGVLNYAFGNEVSGVNIAVPYNTGVTTGNIVYITSTGFADKAQANDVCTSEVAGVVVGFTGSYAQVATVGKISGSGTIETFLGSAGATLKKGVVYFLSSGVSGAGTTAEPNTLEYISKPVVLGLTGDTGLLLPFRGYKGAVSAGVCGSSTTTSIVGVCGGVLSFNGPTGYLYNSQQDFELDVVRTEGHVVGLNRFLALTPDAGSYSYYKNLQFGFNYESPFELGLQSTLSSNKPNYRTVRTFSGNLTRLKIEFPKSNIKQYNLFSTSGVTGDVWKLKNIKFHIQDPPTKSFSFSLVRIINRFGSTNFIEDANVNDSNVDECPANIGLRFGISEISAINAFTGIAGTASSITGLTVLKPRINTPFKTTFVSTTYTGDGATAGNLLPSPNWSTFSSVASTLDQNVTSAEENTTPGSGKYPIIYGRELHAASTPEQANAANNTMANRNYTWDIVSNVVGNTTTQKLLSEVIFSSMEGTSIDFAGATSGVTMDTSILGWNANYGAISEGLYIHIYDNETTTRVPVIQGYDAKKTGMIFLEMAKYDLNTKQEGATVIIPVHLERDYFELIFDGNDLNRAGKIYP